MSSKFKFWAIAVGFIAFLWLLTPDQDPVDKKAMFTMPVADGVVVPENQGQTAEDLPSPMYAGDAALKLIAEGKIPGVTLPPGTTDSSGKVLTQAPAAQAPAQPTEDNTPATFRSAKIRIQTQRGILPLIAGIADTNELRERGMMHYRQWPKQLHGVLFLFDAPFVVTMWMKNTYLPLDILFMDAAGKIIRIEENAQPLSDKTISSEQPAQMVLEIPAGAAKKWNIAVGDTFLAAK